MPQQSTRFASVTTPLGEDALLFCRMNGHEEISRLFEYELDLLVENKGLGSIVTGGFPINNVLGQAMTVALPLPGGDTRYFHGLVAQFRHYGAEDDCLLYRAVLRPWLWFLTRNSNCQIFQDKSVPDIIKKIFSDNGYSDFEIQLTQTYKPRNYCVQYRESDFNFVSRLMECEGIFYFFRHEETKHILVIADSVSAYQTIPGYASIPYYPPENTGQRQQDHIYNWQMTHKVQSGTYVLNDYDFEKPKSNLLSKFTTKKPYSHADGEQYDYPGNYLEPSGGEAYATVRLDELQTEYEAIQGTGNAMGLTSGMLFTLKNHYLAPENTKHIVVFASFTIVSNAYRSSSAEDSHYECNFKAIRSTQQFRPPRLTPVPFVQGPQTAVVVGKEGEEIWTDKYGRVKVKFHWDRDDKMNETSSCWIRVATPIAGKNWGWLSLPRISQEVVVSFLEGNPDRPLITGSVYNANQMPPYELPANQTQSGIKSHSSKGGFNTNFNEIRLEDKKGKEQVFIHAERNQDVRVKNDLFEWIGNERHLIVKKNLFEQVDGDHHATVKGDRNEKINGTLSIKADQDIQEKVGMKHALDAGQEIHLKAGMNVVIEAGMSITLKAGGGFVVIGPAGVTISGTPVLINSGGSAGSGSGSSPEAAKLPKEAANSKGGEKGEITPRPPKPKTYGAAATVLKQAAKNGTPFCEECEKAKKGGQ
ncbi:MAG: type VI secretion system tip protein TssI/VgrG [Methylococcales bacterium]|nr:type VI secretion system tip protein TssI/VgrG [Methylococcales bacterium]